MAEPLDIPSLSPAIPRLGNRFSAWLGRTVLQRLGWQFEGQFPTHGKMVIAVAPHTSNWDFVLGLAVAFTLRLKITFFGKHTLFFPPFDRLMRRWGGIPIERSRAHGVVEQIVANMKSAEQMLLCIAPEGTRSPVFPWKTGFVHIAHAADVPLFLVGLDYQRKKVVLGPCEPVVDVVQSMQQVYAFFARVPAKYPANVITSVEKEIDS
ncbi:1-acyl-sn-glycerol-3-phosphate acyltransferase [Aestuariibacter halophilus]|uniref:1-acyl-sn-glycerol-3-phosphate acyltransferase n=1 Tax=Fluctibacter halophilus TaxID=226011 RepID=A0ABS8G5J6_9ALTE|nr:1-acyl-sn-glycerol-3-phosphate acyltransferase [Aestuariibacter halophilus]MCC2615769.1 1-acyl-sn-glycerol-3-phosphate acyltransferase [Aestuariibacter halophilus]